MPLIRIEYDNVVVADNDAHALSVAVRDIVAKETGIEDVFVYGNSAKIKVQTAPIEIFVEMSAHKIKDADELIGAFRKHILQWKNQTRFPHLINLTLIPMHWKMEIGI